MSDILTKVIVMIKEDMDAHAHESMNLPTPDLAKYCEIVGAYRGMAHCLNIINASLREDLDKEENS